MNLHELGCLCIRNGYEHPRLVVNTTATVAANIPNCLNVDDGAVALDEGARHIDYASERQVGDGRNKDVHTSLGPCPRSPGSYGQQNQTGDSDQRESRMHLRPPATFLADRIPRLSQPCKNGGPLGCTT